MIGATGFFNFTLIPDSGPMKGRRFAVAYKPPGPFNPAVLQHVLLDAAKGPLVPDTVVLLCVAEDVIGNLRGALRTPLGRDALSRLEGRIPVIFAELSLKSGEMIAKAVGSSFPSTRRTALQTEIQSSADQLIKAGLQSAFPEQNVILRAPPGYAYQKPSGDRNSLFLKPELGLTTSAAVSFVAFALFKRLYCGQVEYLKDIETVFVDTMAISNVAYGLRELFELLDDKAHFFIESFHSYGGFEAVKRPLRKTSLCIISASSSMNLYREWLLEKRVDQSDVITLITFEIHPGAPVHGALLAVPRPKDVGSEGPPQLVLRIEGETFLPNQEADKKVVLREQVHGCVPEIEVFRDFAGKGIFDIYRRPAAPNTRPRALFIDGERLLEQEEFQTWVEEQVTRRVRAITRWIVYQPDAASQQLAALVESYCIGKLEIDVAGVLPSHDLLSAPIKETDGVVICAAVIGKGSHLLEVSRALRDKHDGPRLYLIGFQVSEARSELSTLASNLKHHKAVPHEVAIFQKAAIGTQLLASYSAEKRQLYPVGTDLELLPQVMRSRAQAVGETDTVNDLALLPHGASLGRRLRIREGWAFWPDGYSAETYQPETLATVAVLLQRAREDKSVPLDDQLASQMFQHVVLGPENFTRFNDGILQAALLRNAYPSELDYRADVAASDFMKSVILRAIRNSSEEAGEATLEFVLALVTKRLQLFDTHRDEVIAEIETNKEISAVISSALRFLLRPIVGPVGGNASPI